MQSNIQRNLILIRVLFHRKNELSEVTKYKINSYLVPMLLKNRDILAIIGSNNGSH